MINANLSGKRVLITGAASGIGLATAELMAASGAQVVMNDLPGNKELESQVKRLLGKGWKVSAEPADISDEANVKSMVASAVARLNGLDYLVNNAGTPATSEPIPADRLDMQTEDFWQKILSVNLLGAFRCTAAAISSLQDAKGAIVNTASVAGIVGAGSSSAYSASKAALINLGLCTNHFIFMRGCCLHYGANHCCRWRLDTRAISCFIRPTLYKAHDG